ncbi:MAG: formamidopyrimidine-DNA glycosylase [Actinomycetota bacterium]|jgi:formamidopyrimidine-DNA glycosylase|nr:formamidopyrimidine-DNA glycosylase [Actinomycetota bacterium]
MPELVEVEAYRRLAEGVVGRTVAEVVAPDAWYLKRGLDPATAEAVLTGATVTGTRRIGKLLMLDLDRERPVLGLRFGMSGRLMVDGHAGVDELIYLPRLVLDRWDRFGLRFVGGGELRMQDPRRLGGVELDPPEARMGPDALTIGPAALAVAIGHGRSTAPLKARLMDQSRIAGVGNLAADEMLWRAGLDPARAAGSLSPAELRRLHRHLRATMADLLARGGSHAGDLMAERRVGGVCPKDGTPLVRRTVGGRTTFSCPKHQT